MEKIKELKILKSAWTIPNANNKKHARPFATIEYISIRGNRRRIVLDEGKIKNNLLLVNDGRLYAPVLRLYYYGRVDETDKKARARQSYASRKEETRAAAQEWQRDQSPKSWGQVAEEIATLEKSARRYGLIKEFKKEGIL